VVLEIVEHPTEGGCEELDRRVFERRALGRIKEEFGDQIEVRWRRPGKDETTRPATFCNGCLVHDGGYLVWEVLRPVVAHALALEIGAEELVREAEREMSQAGMAGCSWQEGLLRLSEGAEGPPEEEGPPSV